jgi:hypothetical protein
VVEVVVVGTSVVSAAGGADVSAVGGTGAAPRPLRPGNAWAAMVEKAPVSARLPTTVARVSQLTRRSPASRRATGSLRTVRLSRADLKGC